MPQSSERGFADLLRAGARLIASVLRQFGQNIGSWRTVAYALAIGALASMSQIGHWGRLSLLLAVALALPFGLGALVGLYLLTGLFNWAAAGFITSSSHKGGCDLTGHCWQTGTPVGAHGLWFSACIALLFAGVGVANAALIRSVRANRREAALHPRAKR